MVRREADESLDLVDFWLSAGPPRWFARSDEFDDACGRYKDLWQKGRDGQLEDWAETATGSFALIILLDQIPRNIFRGSAEQFTTDPLALKVAEGAVAAGFAKAQALPAKNFYYLPYQHAEDIAVQEKALDLYRATRNQEAYYWALVHHDVIRRFGRFPHRNKMLGRETTPEEKAYLDSGGFGA